jgi:hypothetical protein
MKRAEAMKIDNKAHSLMQGDWFPKKGKRLSILYYYILEDANFHTLNSKLTMLGHFGSFRVSRYETGNVYTPNSYGTEYAEKRFKEYRRLGGRTWE